jgi:hypothetical protein
VVVTEQALGDRFCLDSSFRGTREARTVMLVSAATNTTQEEFAASAATVAFNLFRCLFSSRIPCISVHCTGLRHHFFWIVLHYIRGFAGRNNAAFAFFTMYTIVPFCE